MASKAILSGLVMPELEAELDRLRVRKSELEDIIARRTSSRPEVDPAAIVKLFQESAAAIDSTKMLPAIIRQHITKIFAHADGTFTVCVGVHMNGAGVHNGLD